MKRTIVKYKIEKSEDKFLLKVKGLTKQKYYYDSYLECLIKMDELVHHDIFKIANAKMV